MKWYDLLLGCLAQVTLAVTLALLLGQSTPPEISLEQAQRLHQDGVLFVDARSSKAYSQWHIEGALSLPWSAPLPPTVIEHLRGLPLTIVYCQSKRCDEAARLVDRLRQYGIDTARVLSRGAQGWKQAGLPGSGPQDAKRSL